MSDLIVADDFADDILDGALDEFDDDLDGNEDENDVSQAIKSSATAGANANRLMDASGGPGGGQMDDMAAAMGQLMEEMKNPEFASTLEDTFAQLAAGGPASNAVRCQRELIVGTRLLTVFSYLWSCSACVCSKTDSCFFLCCYHCMHCPLFSTSLQSYWLNRQLPPPPQTKPKHRPIHLLAKVPDPMDQAMHPWMRVLPIH